MLKVTISIHIIIFLKTVFFWLNKNIELYMFVRTMKNMTGSDYKNSNRISFGNKLTSQFQFP